MTSDSWSTSQLVEFLAVLSEQRDEDCALRAAVERVLESLDAEVGLLFGRDTVLTVVGLAAVDPQVATLAAAARTGADQVWVDGLGRCRTAVVALDFGEDAVRLLVVRAGADEFVPDEMLLLRGMAWVLHLALRPLRVMVLLGERQRMLEQVARVQRAIANRAPLPEVFDTVTASALDLFGTELAMLYLADQGVLMVASVSTTLRPRRSSSSHPVLLLRMASCCDTADGVRYSASAAATTVPWSAKARSVRSCRTSIMGAMAIRRSFSPA